MHLLNSLNEQVIFTESCEEIEIEFNFETSSMGYVNANVKVINGSDIDALKKEIKESIIGSLINEINIIFINY